jgi:hypothetical protein
MGFGGLGKTKTVLSTRPVNVLDLGDGRFAALEAVAGLAIGLCRPATVPIPDLAYFLLVYHHIVLVRPGLP